LRLNNYEYINIIDIASKDRIPFAVTIELNTICNLKCEHCYIPSHTNEGMDTECFTACNGRNQSENRRYGLGYA